MILPPKVELLVLKQYDKDKLGGFIYMKVNNEQKLDIAKKHLNQGITLRELSEAYDLNLKNIKYFISLYQIHGEKVFLERENLGEYTRETKLAAITQVLEKGRSQRSVALENGLMDSTILRDWIRIYQIRGEEGIQTTRRRRSYELIEDKLNRVADRELRERIEYLEAENAYLKKLHTLVLQRNQQQKKK